MFVARKLAKLRKEAAKQLRRAEKELSQHPQAMERGKLEEHLAHLREAMAGDDFDKILKHTRAVKHNVDQHVPIWRHSVVLEYTEAILVALVLAMFIRTFIVQAFKIPSGSMIPTLYVGDHILVNKFVFGLPIPFSDKKIDIFGKPQRGDVIVFKFPKDTSKDYIKRVIGLPGDTIEARGNELFINGEPVPKEKAGLYRYEDPARFNQTSELSSRTSAATSTRCFTTKTRCASATPPRRCRPAITSAWATTAIIPTTAATGALCPSS